MKIEKEEKKLTYIDDDDDDEIYMLQLIFYSFRLIKIEGIVWRHREQHTVEEVRTCVKLCERSERKREKKLGKSSVLLRLSSMKKKFKRRVRSSRKSKVRDQMRFNMVCVCVGVTFLIDGRIQFILLTIYLVL